MTGIFMMIVGFKSVEFNGVLEKYVGFDESSICNIVMGILLINCG